MVMDLSVAMRPCRLGIRPVRTVCWAGGGHGGGTRHERRPGGIDSGAATPPGVRDRQRLRWRGRQRAPGGGRLHRDPARTRTLAGYPAGAFARHRRARAVAAWRRALASLAAQSRRRARGLAAQSPWAVRTLFRRRRERGLLVRCGWRFPRLFGGQRTSPRGRLLDGACAWDPNETMEAHYRAALARLGSVTPMADHRIPNTSFERFRDSDVLAPCHRRPIRASASCCRGPGAAARAARRARYRAQRSRLSPWR